MLEDMTDTFGAAGLEFEASLRCLRDGVVSIDSIPTDYLCIPMFFVLHPHTRLKCLETLIAERGERI